MGKLFRNKFRSDSDRYKGYDYSSPGGYYFTICTRSRNNTFGEIVNGEMVLPEIGRIVNEEWLKTPCLRADMNLTQDDYIIMPDHFHGIIIIGENQYNTKKNDYGVVFCRGAMHCASTKISDKIASMKSNTFGTQSKNLASIIRGFKSAVTIRARRIDPHFEWQSRYYDHIIRTNADLSRIRAYIKSNPSKWHSL